MDPGDTGAMAASGGWLATQLSQTRTPGDASAVVLSGRP
jgi:hypothetical protein